MKNRLLAVVLMGFVGSVGAAPAPDDSWTQWGGPARDFAVATPALEPWGELGPKVLWWRPLGPGYSGILTDGDRLYTMTRKGSEEEVVCLSTKDGRELWRTAYPAPTDNLGYIDKSYGDAPQSTPLLAEGRIYGFGFSGILVAVDAETGELAWSRNLAQDFGTGTPYFGHAASPLQVGDTVVVLAGGAHAFDLTTGELRWKNREFAASYASPILVETPIGPQIVAAAAGELVGLSPEDGRLLWRHEHVNRHKTFLSSPAVAEDGTLFASAYFLGSIGLRFGDDGKVTELWEVEDLQVSQSNALALGEMVVASHNRNLVAMNVKTGETLWRERGVGRSNMVRLGDQALLLDDRGRLTLARLDRAGFEKLAQASILQGRSWTAPTVVGTRLYVRNGSEIVAVDLGASAANQGETVAGLRSGQDAGPIKAPKEFVEALAQVERAALGGESAALEDAFQNLEVWDKGETAPFVAFAQGFGHWQRSTWGPDAQRLANLDRAVESVKRAVELREGFAEAHALLSILYSAYYRVSPARASVVGPIGDDHLARALELQAEEPLVMAIRGLDFLNSPPRYGGDPERGRALLEEAIQKFDQSPRAEDDPGPRWGPAVARVWLAERRIRDGEKSAAAPLLEEAVRRIPDFRRAQRLLETARE